MKPAHSSPASAAPTLYRPAPTLCCHFDLLKAEDGRPGVLVGDGVRVALLEVVEEWLYVDVEGNAYGTDSSHEQNLFDNHSSGFDDSFSGFDDFMGGGFDSDF